MSGPSLLEDVSGGPALKHLPARKEQTHSSLTQQYGATLPHSDLGTTRTRIYHSTDATEEWQQHNYNKGSTHRTVIELASHIQISSKTSNITTPTRKHADTQHLATGQKARPPPRSHTLQGLYGNMAEHTNSQSTGMLSQNYIYTPLQRNLPRHNVN